MANLNLHSDSEWIEKVRTNSQLYLKEIYMEYRSELKSWLISKYGISEEEAKDIYQETMYVFFRNISEGKLTKLTASLKTYLFAIAKNLTLSELSKKQKVIAKDEKDITVNIDQLSIDAYREVEEESLNERAKAILFLLKKMNEPCKSIINGYYLEQLSHRELAMKLNYASSNVVKVQKHRCMKQLLKAY